MSSNSHDIDIIELSSDDEGGDKVNISSDIEILEQDSGLCLDECKEDEEGDQEAEVPVMVQDGPLTKKRVTGVKWTGESVWQGRLKNMGHVQWFTRG